LNHLPGPFQDDHADADMGSGLKQYLLDLQVRWQRGEVSNLAYLMRLNTLEGRTTNDLTQYPVFPWVLKDYVSDELDLNNEASYRDLSKPMGAQNEERLKQFQARYEAFDDVEDEGTDEVTLKELYQYPIPDPNHNWKASSITGVIIAALVLFFFTWCDRSLLLLIS